VEAAAAVRQGDFGNSQAERKQIIRDSNHARQACLGLVVVGDLTGRLGAGLGAYRFGLHFCGSLGTDGLRRCLGPQPHGGGLLIRGGSLGLQGQRGSREGDGGGTCSKATH
jgi:hypothetical protein